MQFCDIANFAIYPWTMMGKIKNTTEIGLDRDVQYLTTGVTRRVGSNNVALVKFVSNLYPFNELMDIL